MKTFELRYLDPGDDSWQNFLYQRPEANIFHHISWLDLLKECYGYHPFIMALYDMSGSIYAGIPIMEVTRPMRGRRWISLPFSDHCIPLTTAPDALDRLRDLFQTLIQKPESPSIEIRWDMLGTESTPTSFVLHTLPLESSFKNVEHRIHHSHRRNVRIAQKNAVRIKHGTDQSDLDAFYALHLETRRRQGVPVQPTAYFRLLKETLLNKGLGFISLAYCGSQCLAGAVFLHWNRTLTYKYGASTEAGLSLRPNHLLFWDAIQWGCTNGYALLDFGRSDLDNDGLRVFKSRWGAQETPLRYFSLPVKTRSPDQEHSLMSTIQNLIRKSPAWVCKLGGEIYYRMVA